MASTPTNCTTCEPYTPKEGFIAAKARKKCGAMGTYICDPVADEVKDLERVKQMAYFHVPIVPFFDGADATLAFFRKMKEQSPTHGACIERIGIFAVGEGFRVVKKVRPGFVLSDMNDTVADSEAEKFIDFVESLNAGMDGDALLDEVWRAHENLKTYGNYFLRVTMVRVAGIPFVYLRVIDCEEMRYMVTLDGEKKVLMQSPLWTWDYISRYTPRYYSVYPDIEKSDGIQETVIHVKNTVVGRNWYGMPDSFKSLRYQLLEAQQGQASTENYANDFIPRIIIEVDSDPEEEDDGFDEAIQATYTNQAQNKKRVVIRRRVPGEKEMTVEQMQPNTDHEYHTAMSDEAERQIVKSHGFHRVLLGSPTPGRLGENQEFAQIYRHVNFTTIRPYRQELLPGFNRALELADVFKNGKPTVTATMSLGFDDLFKEYLEATIAEDRGTPQQQ